MRVVILAPSVRGQRAIEANLEQAVRRVHPQVDPDEIEVVLRTDSPALARAAKDAGEADLIVAREEHLADVLPPWLLAVPRAAGPAARGLVVVPIAWVAARIRRHPGWSAAAVAVAGVATLLALTAAPQRDQGREALPPRIVPTATYPTTGPTSSPPGPPAPTSSPVAPARPRSTRPPDQGRAAGGSAPAAPPAERPAPTRPSSAPAAPQSPRPPASPTTAGPPPAQPTTAEPVRRCFVDLDVLGVPIRLCLPRPSTLG
jgi:hypothetical protein